ncbi:hypothetical protein BV25DRAFT_1768386, partial [Artomyces pyxidatus]
VRIKPKRHAREGHSTVGISALSFMAHPIDPRRPQVVCRGDSGADISLISAEFLESFPKHSRPQLRKGLKMQLYQLTSDAQITGYITLPLLIPTKEGPLISLFAECYVVPGMTVPLLLGEDFHVTYELGVQRSVDQGSSIVVGTTGFSIAASSISATDRPHLRVSKASREAGFVKAKTHARNRANRRRALDNDRKPIARAAEDIRIPAFSNKMVPLQFHSATSAEWFIEKTILGQPDGSTLMTTPTLFTTEDPRVSVSNPSARPQIIKKGDIIGRLALPE